MPSSTERPRYPIHVNTDDDKYKGKEIREDLLAKKDRWEESVLRNRASEKELKDAQPKKTLPNSTPSVAKKSPPVQPVGGSGGIRNKDIPPTPGLNKDLNNLSNNHPPAAPTNTSTNKTENRTPSTSPTNIPRVPEGQNKQPTNPVTPNLKTLNNKPQESSNTGSKTPDNPQVAQEKREEIIKDMKGDFWDKVRNKERNHDFNPSSLQEFVLDRKAQDSIGIQRDPNKVLSEKQQIDLQKETERLRKESGLPAAPTDRDRMYFIDKSGKRQIDLNYLKSHGYNPTIDANIPGAIFLSPNLTPQKGNAPKTLVEKNFAQEAPHAQEALKSVKGYLNGDPGIQKMIKEISDITGTPVLMGGMGIQTSGKCEVLGINRIPQNKQESEIYEQLPDFIKNRNKNKEDSIYKSSGFRGDIDRFYRSIDREQGLLVFAKDGANTQVLRNEVGELWMSAKELQRFGSTGVNNSETTQIATWHTDMALNMNDTGYTKSKSRPESPQFWRSFSDNFNASQKMYGEGIDNSYAKHHKGQPNALVGDTQKQSYASDLYNQRLAYFYDIPVEKVPLTWTFKEEKNGKIRAIPTLKK